MHSNRNKKKVLLQVKGVKLVVKKVEKQVKQRVVRQVVNQSRVHLIRRVDLKHQENKVVVKKHLQKKVEE